MRIASITAEGRRLIWNRIDARRRADLLECAGEPVLFADRPYEDLPLAVRKHLALLGWEFAIDFSEVPLTPGVDFLEARES